MVSKIFSARWVLPISAPPIEFGAVAVNGPRIIGVGSQSEIFARFPESHGENFGEALIIPGLVNTHTHLELTVMRGYLENEDFFAWLRKLTIARLEKLTPDDLRVSATWGACEAARAGITCVGDASDSALMSMLALRDVGLRGVVFQESFGPDPRLVQENFATLKAKVAELRGIETELVRVGVSPHAPYTVCAPQLDLVAEFARDEKLPLMMHAAESQDEELLVRDGCGTFADRFVQRGIEWNAPRLSTIQYLKQRGILDTQPLLAHCIRVDDADIETLRETRSRVAHCPKSNAKLGHGRAPFAKFLAAGVAVGFGSDSVASNNTCDILEEARFAVLLSRAGERDSRITASDAVKTATLGGARCMDLDGHIGELSEGAQADLAVLSLTGAHQTPNHDPAATAVFSSSGRDVILTVVAGREVYREGRVVGVDGERLRARMQEISGKL
ncbi:MAG TPA: amidohydrolase family protein [Pyrinomonadaceae bacterium]|nr:amidohydrolase family protein [Pyrinomonadaceae bacterium]